MKRFAVVLAVAAAAAGVAACSPSVTPGRVSDAIGPEFAALYARHQALLGAPVPPGSAQASATCTRNGSAAATGAGDDWVCQVLLQVGGPSQQFTYEVNVKADGCYTADGPVALVGGRTLRTPSGQVRTNPLFAFDGCFDET